MVRNGVLALVLPRSDQHFPHLMQPGMRFPTSRAVAPSSRLARKLLPVFGQFLFLQPLNEKFNQIQLIAGKFHSAASVQSCFAVSRVPDDGISCAY